MTRTLARLTAWAAVIAILMAVGFLGWLLKAAITPPILGALEALRIALGPHDYVAVWLVYAFLFFGSIWLVYGGFIRKDPTD